MKTFFSLVILGAAIALVNSTATKEISDKLRAAVQKCTKEHNLEISTVQDYVKLQKLPETENGKCAILCYFKEMEYVIDGKFNDENILKSNKLKWSDETHVTAANEVYQMCIKETNLSGVTLDCEAAGKMLSCLKNHSQMVRLPVVDHNLPIPELHQNE